MIHKTHRKLNQKKKITDYESSKERESNFKQILELYMIVKTHGLTTINFIIINYYVFKFMTNFYVNSYA